MFLQIYLKCGEGILKHAEINVFFLFFFAKSKFIIEVG